MQLALKNQRGEAKIAKDKVMGLPYSGKGFSAKDCGKGIAMRGEGKGKGTYRNGSGVIKRNAQGYPVFTGVYYQCGAQGHSGKSCPLRGGPNVFDETLQARKMGVQSSSVPDDSC